MKSAVVLALFAALFLASCAKKSESKPGQEQAIVEAVAPEMVWYRVEILGEEESDLRVIFQLGVDWPLQPEGEAHVANGRERISWAMHCDAEQRCLVSIPVYGASLELEFDSKTTLKGIWRRDPLPYISDAKLRGQRVAGPELASRADVGAAPIADFSGDWLVTSEDFGRSRANFDQAEDGTITGTITPKGVGDARFLAGRVTGKVAHLSTFDGQRAYAVKMTMDTEASIFEGSWLSLSLETRTFTGSRGQAPSLFDELYVDEMASADRRVSIPELDALRGKPVIVDLFGTWCPTCLDTVPTLIALHDEFSAEGLQILSIAYEMTDDEESAKARLAAFHERFKLKWDAVIRLGEDFESLLPKEIEPTGFPITLFVNRDGTVHRMNTGFVSPASKEDHKAVVAAFHRWTEEIMASEPSPPGSKDAGARR